MHLTRDEARTLAVIGQRLDRRPSGKITPARVLELIRYLGCVQLVLQERGEFIGVADVRRDGSAGGAAR